MGVLHAGIGGVGSSLLAIGWILHSGGVYAS